MKMVTCVVVRIHGRLAVSFSNLIIINKNVTPEREAKKPLKPLQLKAALRSSKIFVTDEMIH
jgi:hypothetical protein